MLCVAASGCVYQPNQTTQAVDDRPQVSIAWKHRSITPETAYLYIDGQNFGAVSQFLYPNNSVGVLIGEHLVEVRANGSVIYSQQQYFGEKQSYTVEIR